MNIFQKVKKKGPAGTFFIDYNVDACIYCIEILILTYFDFAFDNVNSDLRNRSGFKYILQLLNICLVFK